LAGVLAVVLAGVGAFLTYQITTAHNDIENITPSSFLLSNYENVSFTDRAGGLHDGWLLRGLKGAPAIILCHGYNSNRSDVLSLGVMLQENHFNVYLFNFQGSKTRKLLSDLGVQQAEDLLTAIVAVTRESGVNPRRVGLYGATTGAYATLVAAQQSPLVKAIVVDSVYASPDQMFEDQLNGLLGGSSPLFRLLADGEFHLFSLRTEPPRVLEKLEKLEGIPKLFISEQDAPLLSADTQELYNRSPEPKRELILERSLAALASGSEKTVYEDQVLSFFQQNLPLRAD